MSLTWISLLRDFDDCGLWDRPCNYILFLSDKLVENFVLVLTFEGFGHSDGISQRLMQVVIGVNWFNLQDEI